MRSIDPSAARLQAFIGRSDSPSPLVMLNLLRYRDVAEYPAGFDAEPCSGREAYRRYGEVAVERVAAVGGRLLWAGQVAASVIAPDTEEWDDVVLVEYPSRDAFLKMVMDPAYQAALPHRSAALLDSRLLATQVSAMPNPMPARTPVSS